MLITLFVTVLSPEEPEKDIMDEFLEQSSKALEQESSSQPRPEQWAGQSHHSEDGYHDNYEEDDDDDEGKLVIAQETEEEENTATPRLPSANLPHRSPPPLIKHESPSR